MKRKEVDDVMGGEGAWDNVDQTEGMTASPSVTQSAAAPTGRKPRVIGSYETLDLLTCLLSFTHRSAMPERGLYRDEGILLHGAN
jgi:hypothetical protein